MCVRICTFVRVCTVYGRREEAAKLLSDPIFCVGCWIAEDIHLPFCTKIVTAVMCVIEEIEVRQYALHFFRKVRQYIVHIISSHIYFGFSASDIDIVVRIEKCKEASRLQSPSSSPHIDYILSLIIICLII